MTVRVRAASLLLLFVVSVANADDWQPADGPLMTRWAAEVSPENALPEYPRPQLVREHWLNLNGLWDYAIRPKDETSPPDDWDGQILVPFAVESALSGVMKPVGPDNRLWYRRTFEVPADKAWQDKRTLLHFGAVDWDCTVWVNGAEVGRHQGGFDPFTFDITDALRGPALEGRRTRHEIVISVWDPTDTSHQPRGKQVLNPGGIFYTAVTGIWQTVWLEPVSQTYVRSVTITPDIDREQFVLQADISGGRGDRVELTARCEFEHRRGDEVVSGESAASASPATDQLRLDVGPGSEYSWWSPDNPALFEITLELKDTMSGEVLDHLATYSALRKIEVKPDDAGVNRLFLNNEPVFQYGPLDQGWWPDGLYTAPTDEALKFDIEITKELGFNMCRKHVKVEPARWYYWCDKLGLLVWQDMPSGDRSIGPDDPDIERSAASEEVYRREWQAIVEALRPFPSIVAWVPFNEGWGQFKTNEILEWTKELDPTRLVDGPSGWADRGGGHMHDMHRYPGPGMFPVEEDRASVLGEFGGLGLPVEGHTWVDKGNWGYRSFTTKEELAAAYEALVGQLPWLIGDGLAAAVYTQTTDVEVEVNGLLTYDREVLKFDAERLRRLHARLYGPTPTTTPLIPTSEDEPQTWRYTLYEPADGWQRPDFDDSNWKAAPGGFGEPSTPGSVVRTDWKSPDIWLRRTFELDDDTRNRVSSGSPVSDQAAEPAEASATSVYLRLHYDEDSEVYINGVLAARVTGYVTEYVLLPVSEAAQQALRTGENTIAVHCHQTGGGQYIDAGLVEVTFGK